MMMLLAAVACTDNNNRTDNNDDMEAYRCLEEANVLNEKEEHDSARTVLARGLGYENAADSTKGMLNAEMSAACSLSGDMDEALKYGRKAMALCRDNVELYVILCGNTGIAYRRLGMNDSAATCYKEGVEVAQRSGYDEGLAYLYNNLAVLYYEMERYDEGVGYSLKAKTCAKKADDEVEYLSAMANEGIGYAKKDDNRRAAELLKAVFGKAESMESTPLKLKVINYLLSACRKLGDDTSVDFYLAKGEQIAREVPATSIAVAGIMESKMNTLLERGNYRAALSTAEELEAIKQFQSMPPYKLLMVKARCHAGLGSHEEAYRLECEAVAMQDSVRNGEVEKQLSEYSVRFKTQEKELEISRLQQEKSTERARMLAIVAALTVVTAVLIIVLLWARLRRKARQQQMEIDMARKYIDGMETERARLARELHDGACNDLLAVGMDMRSGNTGMDELVKRVQTMRTSLRRISHELMPPSFVYASIDEIAADYLTHLVKPDNMNIDYSLKGESWGNIPDKVSYQLYRIMQEAVSNIIRHSSCTHAEVAMTCDGTHISLSVTDNGNGGNVNEINGKGISSMRDRANSIGAQFEWTSGCAGTCIKVCF